VKTYEWRGPVRNDELNALHAEGFGDALSDDDRVTRLQQHSLGWVTARDAGRLIGFVNVAWDGGVHGFLLDTLVARSARRRGIGRALVALATERARAAGCHWLHVDFEPHLRSFYTAGGFVATDAGLIQLSDSGQSFASGDDENA
jgi:GNAT superfamily N-acetyltransferase